MAPGNVPFFRFNAFYPLADFLPNKSTAVLLSVLLAHTRRTVFVLLVAQNAGLLSL